MGSNEEFLKVASSIIKNDDGNFLYHFNIRFITYSRYAGDGCLSTIKYLTLEKEYKRLMDEFIEKY